MTLILGKLARRHHKTLLMAKRHWILDAKWDLVPGSNDTAVPCREVHISHAL
jgi:hypothetical protein